MSEVKKKYDVFGVGNALVDILVQVDERLIGTLGLKKGSMALMSASGQAQILQHVENMPLKLASGGSAANTMVAISQSGGNGVYCGQVAHDIHGEFYRRDMQDTGIGFPVPLAPESELPTGTCVVLTTPDAERTMCTHLGISTHLNADQLDLNSLSQSKFSYVEGYLWDAPGPRSACQAAFEHSRRLGVRTAFTFSDAFLVDRFPADFERIVKNDCDIVFCNADEIRRYFKSESLHDCINRLGTQIELAFVTDSENGCYVVEEGRVTHVPGFPVRPVDTVGAGDAFAGGTLYGLAHGHAPSQAARWGNFMASRVVSMIGPRLPSSMIEHRQSVLTQPPA